MFTSPLVGEVDARSAAGEGYFIMNKLKKFKKALRISQTDVENILRKINLEGNISCKVILSILSVWKKTNY